MAVAAGRSPEFRVEFLGDRVFCFKAGNIGLTAVKASGVIRAQFFAPPFKPPRAHDGVGVVHALTPRETYRLSSCSSMPACASLESRLKLEINLCPPTVLPRYRLKMDLGAFPCSTRLASARCCPARSRSREFRANTTSGPWPVRISTRAPYGSPTFTRMRPLGSRMSAAGSSFRMVLTVVPSALAAAERDFDSPFRTRLRALNPRTLASSRRAESRHVLGFDWRSFLELLLGLRLEGRFPFGATACSLRRMTVRCRTAVRGAARLFLANPRVRFLRFSRMLSRFPQACGKLNAGFDHLGMKLTQPLDKKKPGRPRRAVAETLLYYEYLWVEILCGLRDGAPEIEMEMPPTSGLFIRKSGGQGREWVHSEVAGSPRRIIHQPTFTSTPEEIYQWDSSIRKEENLFARARSNPVKTRWPARPAERHLWEALKRARTATQVRRICSRSKIWLSGRWDLPTGYSMEWFYPQTLYERAEEFCRAKFDNRYPRRDKRESGDYRRIEYLARVMAGLSTGIAPSTAVERLRKMRHPRRCQCWRCTLKIAPRYCTSLARFLAERIRPSCT